MNGVSTALILLPLFAVQIGKGVLLRDFPQSRESHRQAAGGKKLVFSLATLPVLYLATHKIQSILFDVGAHIATPRDKATPKKIGTVWCAMVYSTISHIVIHYTLRMDCLNSNPAQSSHGVWNSPH